MELETTTAPAHDGEVYVAPDVERLGTAQTLTAGAALTIVPGDIGSALGG